MFDTGRSVDEIIESLNEDKIYGLEIHHVLLRKDGALLFPRLKEALLNNPSSHKLNILANYIRPAENRDNYETSGFDDDRFIEEIKDRHYPQIRILSKERIVAIYDRLFNILETEPEADYATDIAFYMFDIFKNLDAIDAERKRRLKVLGTDLCLRYRHPDWGLVVFALLNDFGGGGIIKEKELIALLEEYLDIEGFTDSTSTYVTTLFKHYQNNRERRRLFRRWVEERDLESESTMDWVVEMYLHYTKCSRHALTMAMRFIQHAPRRNSGTVRELLRFMYRKPVRRFLYGFARRNINNQYGQKLLAEVLDSYDRSLPRRWINLGLQAMVNAKGRSQKEIVSQLTECSSDPRVAKAAHALVEKDPDSEESFRLMCNLARSGDKKALSYLEEWLPNSMPLIKLRAMASIVCGDSSKANIDRARVILSDIEAGEIPVLSWQVADYLDALLSRSKEDWIIDKTRLVLNHIEKARLDHPIFIKLKRRYEKSI